MHYVLIGAFVFVAVCLLCWSLLRHQRTVCDFLQREDDWGVQ